MNTQTATLSLRRHDSSELEPIDISSSGPQSKFYAKCAKNGKVWGGAPPAALHDDFVDEDSLDAVGKSWCLGMSVFIILRVILFQYLFATFILLITRDALQKFPVSMMVYLLHLLASLVAIVASITLDRNSKNNIREKKGYLTPPAEKSQTRTSLHPGNSVVRIGTRIGNSIRRNFRITLLILATVLIQNSSAIIFFWDCLFITVAQYTEFTARSDRISSVLLHVYNIIPVLFEVLLGCTVFKLIYFIPGVAAMAGILLRLAASSKASPGKDIDEALELANAIRVHAGEDLSAIPYVFLSMLFVSICVGMIFLQKIQQRVFHK